MKTLRLSELKKGLNAKIISIDENLGDVVRRFMELGFQENAVVEVLHKGWWKTSPLAVRVNNTTTIALRPSEASRIYIAL
jgi:Fe2+ transport system protein FeoA